MTNELEIQGTNVLARNLRAVDKGFTILLNEGGSRSSKTWSILQMLLLRAMEGRCETYTIVRQKLTWVKATVLKDFEALVNLYGLQVSPTIKSSRQEQVYKVNGTEFGFFGGDEPAKLHGRTQDVFWVNEVMEVPQAVFDQLEMRTKKFGILDYNPYDDEHWVFGLQRRPDVITIRSTMLDNKENLSPMIINKIMGYKPTPENYARGTADSYMWDVYGLGKKAKLKGAIFNNWDIVDSIPEGAKDLGLGMDFGYSNDPTTLTEIYIYNNELYLNELIYDMGLLNISPYPEQDTISKRMKILEIGTREITGDSSEPKSIQELYNDGWNINGADKGADSINYGVDLMKGYKIHITRKSVNLEREFRKYKWSEDKNGKSRNVPVDAFNHAIDGIRYRVMKVLGNDYEVEVYPASMLA